MPNSRGLSDLGRTRLCAARSRRETRWRLIIDQAYLTRAVEEWRYNGAGTEEDPYIIKWIDDDRRHPTRLPQWTKWGIVVIISFNALAVSLASLAYSGALPQIKRHFEISEVVGTLGLSQYVLGFAVGPLLYGIPTLFNLGVVFWQNTETLLILRFFAGTFGASPLTNTGGVIVNVFSAADRGIAMNLFAVAPFMGPAVGPIASSFLSEAAGWRWACGLMTSLCGISWLRRADKLSALTGKVYITQFDKTRGRPLVWADIKVALARPFVLLVREPIVLALAVYMSIIYGTLYLLFGAYPFVLREARGWSEGIANLPFLGILVGIALNFWLAWTNYPSIEWFCPVIASSFFGFSMVLIFVSGKNYLADAYTIFAPSAPASTVLLRSILGAVFPLFTPYMFRNHGFPFVFHRYGAWIKKRCKFTQAANEYFRQLQSRSERKEQGESKQRAEEM
ncbi:hypothetical protein BDV12DRAFT_184891 [Aspergillus spectabilis]